MSTVKHLSLEAVLKRLSTTDSPTHTVTDRRVSAPDTQPDDLPALRLAELTTESDPRGREPDEKM